MFLDQTIPPHRFCQGVLPQSLIYSTPSPQISRKSNFKVLLKCLKFSVSTSEKLHHKNYLKYMYFQRQLYHIKLKISSCCPTPIFYYTADG